MNYRRNFLMTSVLLLSGFLYSVEAQTQVASSATKVAATTKAKRAKGDLRRVFTFRAGATTLFDSNVENDPIGRKAYGVIPNLGFRYQVDWGKNAFEANYEVAQHVYNVSTKYNRNSHAADMSYERQFTDKFRSKTTADVNVRGSTEEREINNQFSLIERLEYRLDSKNRFYLIGAYRVKCYRIEDRDSNSSNPYWGAKYRRYLGKAEVEAGYRYEKNKAQSARNTYIQQRYEVSFKTPLFYRSTLDLNATYKPRLYAGRYVAVNGSDVPRRDRRWKFEANWERPMTDRFTLGAFYKFEKRNSNDIDKLFNAHQVGIAFRFNWVKEFDN